jgi:hypothetical protein
MGNYMKKRNNFNLLFNINVRMAFNKKSIIAIIFSFLILILYLTYISYNSYVAEEYLSSYNDVHSIYLKEGLSLVNIINSLLTMVLITTLFVNTDSFDSMYVSYIPRNIISKSKIWTLIFLELIMIIIEYLALTIPAVIIFPYYKIEINNLYILGYITIYGMIQTGVTILLISLMNNNFIPMLGFIISFVLQIFASNFKDKFEGIKYFVPINYMNYNVPYIGFMIFFMSMLFYKSKFSIKNIN